MKNLRPLSRRMLAVTASAIIGLVGAVALASPASAHHTSVSGFTTCADPDTGEWTVTWTVTNSETNKRAKLILVDPDSTVDNIHTGAELPKRVWGEPDSGKLVGTQVLGGEVESATLNVQAQWEELKGNGDHKSWNGVTERRPSSHTVPRPDTCEVPEEPGAVDVQASSTCEALIIVLTNPADGEETTAQVQPSTAEGPEDVLVPVNDSVTLQYPGTEGLSVDVTIGEETTTYTWEPENCDEEVDVPIAYLPDCDSLTIEVTNPLEDETIEATIVSGDQSETLTIEPGSTGEATFDAEEGTVATITIGDESLEIPWEEPEDCGGEGGELPVTGNQTVMAAGAALALLALGSGLFLLTRRRRVTFTV